MGWIKSSRLNKLIRRFNGLVLLNISGLALGLASVIFIAIWVSHELSYDRFYEKADRIYRVESLINFTGDPSVCFLAAILIIVMISALTLVFHTVKAANMNPADTLRNE